jgi:flagellar motility protein MotE (MotC chaperone)
MKLFLIAAVSFLLGISVLAVRDYRLAASWDRVAVEIEQMKHEGVDDGMRDGPAIWSDVARELRAAAITLYFSKQERERRAGEREIAEVVASLKKAREEGKRSTQDLLEKTKKLRDSMSTPKPLMPL